MSDRVPVVVPFRQLDNHPRVIHTCTGLWVLVALPALLLALSKDWSVTPPGLIDPWVYFGYYQNLPQHLSIFDGTYYGTRLSTILPGFVAYHCLPPVAANYVLHLGLYYLCVFSLYMILSRTVSARAGLLAAACLGCHFFFLRAIGWDYVNGFGITYFFLAILALTTAARSAFWKTSLVAAGMASAAFVIANLFYAIFLPYLAIHYVFVNRQIRRNPLVMSLWLYLIGATGLIFSFCVYSGWIAGRFWFLGPTLVFTSTHLGRANPWKAPLSTWLPGADWLVLPMLTALGCGFFFYRLGSGLRPLYQKEGTIPPTLEGPALSSGTIILYQLQFLFALALMIGWEWRGQPVLQCPEYASLLLPAALLAFGAQLGPHVERLEARQFRVLVEMASLTLLAPYALGTAGEWLTKLSCWSAVITMAVGTIGVVFLSWRQAGAVWAAGTILLFFSFPCAIASHTFSPTKGLPTTAFFKDAHTWGREHYQPVDVLRCVSDAVQVVQKWDPSGQDRFWYAARAPMGNLCTAISSTYLWGYRLVNFEFPAVTDRGAFARLKGQRLIILSADPQALAKANATMDELGLEAHLLAEHRIEYPSVGLSMCLVLIRVKGLPQQPLTADLR